MSVRCKNCDMDISYSDGHYCEKCRQELAGKKPKKSKNLCIGCSRDWYNKNRKNGCYGYDEGEIIIKEIYFSIREVIPKPKWKLSCYNKQH